MQIKLVEVGLRDGLQNERIILGTEDKVRVAKGLLAAGVRHLEVTSFVSPRWIPQLADATQLAHQLPSLADVVYRALVPNRKGAERAAQTPIHEWAVFMSASETHNRKNINKSISDTYPVLREVMEMAKEQGIRVRGYVSTVFGCPYEGKVSTAQVLRVCEQLLQMGVYEISLGDTIGVATPKAVKSLLQECQQHIPLTQIAGHFHDTRGTGLTNAYTALEMGVRTLDTSLGGLGGCPYAPGASGNLATEDVLYLLQQEGIDTGIDLARVCETSEFVQTKCRRPLPSKVLQSHLAQKRQEKRGDES
ncbi:hydroxymethylglutaryl-CoA lyase [Laceyella sacchari]|uniref:Hydroxymethylglutaryl-CoA lyase n=1 Tax=Laceyella tengchongensis TaxID=574699 RepID=A0AA45WLI7_9BACL|nr:hydroxymethylglutaryl-CoA lyase [Laceyella tengchongensis]AUS09358.1 hydroxymethylglutaryl-CoA lyase [Laceyella sacchari]SMP11168.1 hydroxymethylglutaryl-CoA lyase [Laceyella tengchongensis]